MVISKFSKKDNIFNKFEISGHANAGNYGNDLVCAGVTAIVSGALNAFDQKFDSNIDITVNENKIVINVISSSEELQIMMDMLFTQLKTIEIQYPKNFKIEEVL